VPVGEVRTAVNEGSSFADALAKHPKIFDELYVSMVRAGEVAGNLDEVLERLADFLDSAQKLKGKVQSAMIYPIIMLIVGAIIMAVLMVR
jgi:type II secretory pathway component PulF